MKAANPEFVSNLLARLPLELNDEAVEGVANEFGWREHFWKAPSVSLAKAPPSADVQQVLAQAARVPVPAPQLTPLIQSAGAGQLTQVSKATGPPPVPTRILVAPPKAAGVAAKAASVAKAAPPRLAEVGDGDQRVAEPPTETQESTSVGEADRHWNALPEEDEQCSICYEGYQEDNDAMVLSCGHQFHTLCLQRWRSAAQQGANMGCPMCRRPTGDLDRAQPAPAESPGADISEPVAPSFL